MIKQIFIRKISDIPSGKPERQAVIQAPLHPLLDIEHLDKDEVANHLESVRLQTQQFFESLWGESVVVQFDFELSEPDAIMVEREALSLARIKGLSTPNLKPTPLQVNQDAYCVFNKKIVKILDVLTTSHGFSSKVGYLIIDNGAPAWLDASLFWSLTEIARLQQAHMR